MAQERYTFPGHAGHMLAGRLETPDNGGFRGVALFAHCFTCGKDFVAARRIAAGLVSKGFAVLRFDFTGLGNSQGDFGNTGFAANVEDLVAAADDLRERIGAPTLLVGHSLGGAAVLAAAHRIPEVRAVATLGAPADPEHVLHQFQADVPTIEAEGEADVTLGGRQFRIQKSFVDDMREHKPADRLAHLHRALLILHAPTDSLVGIENAQALFTAAKHPKSFVSLDDADHLITKPEDATYAADVIAAWSSKYVEADTRPAHLDLPEPSVSGQVTAVETGEGRFQTRISAAGTTIMADEPARLGGGGTGPAPYDLLLSALGACSTMTLRMYANRKRLPLTRSSIALNHEKVDDGQGGKIDKITRTIKLEGDLDEATRQRLLEIADKCPVHKTLTGPSVIVESSFVDDQT